MPIGNMPDMDVIAYSTDGGKTYKPISGKIPEISPYTKSEEKVMRSVLDEKTFEMSCEFPRAFVRYVICQVFPNNWLKMHGYPIRRRRRK